MFVLRVYVLSQAFNNSLITVISPELLLGVSIERFPCYGPQMHSANQTIQKTFNRRVCGYRSWDDTERSKGTEVTVDGYQGSLLGVGCG